MTDIDPDDVKAMRKEGSLRDYLRLQITNGKARRQPAKPAPPPAAPGHIPGAWPAGSRPPGPLPPQPPAAWDTALADHRRWLATTHHTAAPEPGQHCPCGCTPPTRQENP